MLCRLDEACQDVSSKVFTLQAYHICFFALLHECLSQVDIHVSIRIEIARDIFERDNNLIIRAGGFKDSISELSIREGATDFLRDPTEVIHKMLPISRDLGTIHDARMSDCLHVHREI